MGRRVWVGCELRVWRVGFGAWGSGMFRVAMWLGVKVRFGLRD